MMNMLRFLFVGISLYVVGIPNISEAAMLDAYKTMVANKSFTLRYRILEEPKRHYETELDLFFADRKKETNPWWRSIPSHGILVVRGDTVYTETITGSEWRIGKKNTDGTLNEYEKDKEIGDCRLIKNGEVFNFQRFQHWHEGVEQKPDYYGDGVGYNKVEAGRDEYARFLAPYDIMVKYANYGDPTLDALLGIIHHDSSRQIVYTPQYSRKGSGTLPSGLAYEDYAAQAGDEFYAARFYFQNGKLVRLASAVYPTSLDIENKGFERFVVKIDEFSPTPEAQYLSLPEGVKDITKR
ncbi:MAG: hypothetical protein IJ849_07030 [Selenomonadaceae bacterium]|nr:hypothetical protein [Selenomonadaceae bacterium]